MEINIRHCNNFTSAKISIEAGKLNIKFAPNGTGKSTISKAIQFASTKNDKALAELLPFKFRSANQTTSNLKLLALKTLTELCALTKST